MSTLHATPTPVNLTPWRALSAAQRTAELDRIRREYPIRPGDCPELDERLEREYPISHQDPAEDPRWDDTRERPGDEDPEDEDTVDLPGPPIIDPDDDPDTTTPDENWPGRGMVEAAEFGPALPPVSGGCDNATRAVTDEDWEEFGRWSAALDFPETANPDWMRCPAVRDWDREFEESREWPPSGSWD